MGSKRIGLGVWGNGRKSKKRVGNEGARLTAVKGGDGCIPDEISADGTGGRRHIGNRYSCQLTNY